MAAFSRWQLAAALLEYDNDQENPDVPRKNAYDSALFAPLRKANANIRDLKQPPPASPDFLGVKLPSESGLPSEAGMDTHRRSKASIDMLHNPFGEDEEEEPEEEDLEVDLASWGLDSLMPEEKPAKKSKGAKGKAKSDTLTNTVGVGRRPVADRPAHNRTMSMPLAEFGEGGAFLEANGRRNTISDPANLAEIGVLEKPSDRQRLSTHPLIENLPVRPPLHSLSSYEQARDTVPFPISSPMPEQSEANVAGGSRPASRLNLLSEEESNPFAIPPPPPSRASRFDPKYAAHARTMSNATRLSMGPQMAYDGDNQNRTPSRASILDVKSTRDRRLSTASFGTRDMLVEDDFQSAYGGEEYQYPARERRYSRLDLMRPKLLVMPSPLQTQSTGAPAPAPKITRTKDGFLDTSDGRPMPPGARASRMSMLAPSSVPVAANSFTPNPRLSLTASQLLFRNTLLVDGQKDVSYNDIDGDLERAKEDGEQIKLEIPEEPEKPEATALPMPDLAEEAKRSRPAGKLFGRSLIDDLEARKQEIRGKQRVFTGDQRPSMMDRGSLNRSSTLIDPSTLGTTRPTASRMPSTQTDTQLVRRGSRGGKPLLTIDDNGQIAETGDSPRESKLPQRKSVFGVDTLWEREMVKLKEIEEREKKDEEERMRREEEEEEKKAKKKKKKSKGQERFAELSPSPSSVGVSSAVSPQAVSPQADVRPPSLTLPAIPTVTSRKRSVPIPDDDESDNESSASEAAPTQSAALQEDLADQWVSDDEKKPISAAPQNVPPHPRINIPSDDDSDEDLPLSVTLQRAAQKLASPRSQPVDDDDSDEDRPLSMMLLNKSSLGSFNVRASGLSDGASKSHENEKGDDDEDDDDVPLGIRASRLPPGASQVSGLSAFSSSGRGGNNNNNDDDRPLSMHPAQIRKSQFQMFAQVQQAQVQQQQMLQAQAQMTNSMLFPHPQSMMFMMPPAAAAPLVPPAPPPPPMQDINKFSSVDRWRRDVAIEQN